MPFFRYTTARRPGPWLPVACTVITVLPLVLLSVRVGFAQAPSVPAEVQAQLLSKLVAYDRNFTERAGATAHVLIVSNPGDTRSELSAKMMRSALAQIERLGRLPHKESIVAYETVASLVARVRNERVAIVYVTPGLEREIESMRAALSGIDLLTVAAVPEYVPSGIVLGFELEQGKPKIAINLAQAKRQSVAFEAKVLKLMKVYR